MILMETVTDGADRPVFILKAIMIKRGTPEKVAQGIS